ncbi:type I-D CRISPR-associated endonuclease Cas1 [Geitlerinema sp. P-1104]|uniref:type I-D CRISPR-associated endonuclease Cas1d n=1 Tax=Geitlerinema sp. P-1104 TaxID=2546230 RepID=UPI00147697A4|nr:type I-D CRISPR-associated endonuclease Cas1d [Geitlerinema sp. P-1104]NMG58476.1 type I-D CRISPR-associated endonuclease Cas1 [Geitlerinema sp. P-1104]
MSVLYITQPDAILSKKYEAFRVGLKQDDQSWVYQSIPAQTVEQVVLMGNPGITGDALTYALELGLSVHYLTRFGKYLGSALPGHSRNGQLRLAQYRAYCDETQRLAIVQEIVTGKIHNQYGLLYRRGVKENPLKLRKAAVAKQADINATRGIEGLAAREYFGCWPDMLKSPWTFTGRHRPATDPVNALLNFAYGLLRVQVTAAVHLAGLDPYVGYLHETIRGQPAMVLDLMEEFRPLVADSLVLSVVNLGELQLSDFEESLGTYRLSDGARRCFLEAFERKMTDEFKHPLFGYRCTYRRAIELQARLFARHLQEGVSYRPLVRR